MGPIDPPSRQAAAHVHPLCGTCGQQRAEFVRRRSGIASVGAVGSDEQVDITAMGDVVNVAARLASAAGAGEVLVTEESVALAGIDVSGRERRELMLKGRSTATSEVVLGAA